MPAISYICSDKIKRVNKSEDPLLYKYPMIGDGKDILSVWQALKDFLRNSYQGTDHENGDEGYPECQIRGWLVELSNLPCLMSTQLN